MTANVATKVPTFFLRYEDLIVDPEANLTAIFKFIFGRDSIEGTVLAQRISQVAAEFRRPPAFASATLYSLE